MILLWFILNVNFDVGFEDVVLVFVSLFDLYYYVDLNSDFNFLILVVRVIVDVEGM